MILGYGWLFILLSLSVLGLAVWSVRRDNMASLNALAVRWEPRLPSWLRFERWGDPATWVHHVLVTMVVSIVGAILAMLSGTEMGLGAFAWGCGGAAYYLYREVTDFLHHLSHREEAGNAIWRGPPHYTGWVVDCLGDGLLPVLYVWWLGASQGVF
tara:strand:- start:53 stop:520 length:468 start_codon:yes stop_codon:yes gene_type:complete